MKDNGAMTSEGAGQRLNRLLERAGIAALDERMIGNFEKYVSLILRWNARFNLTSLRTESAILSKHLVESIACAMALPQGIVSLLDYGSGAGLPGIPIALCRPEIAVTLAESQGKKAAFLQETIRVLGIAARVHAGRAEKLGTLFDCVMLRAVDRMPRAVAAAVQLIVPDGWLVLMITGAEVAQLRAAAGAGIAWEEPARLPFGDDRILAMGRRVNS